MPEYDWEEVRVGGCVSESEETFGEVGRRRIGGAAMRKSGG